MIPRPSRCSGGTWQPPVISTLPVSIHLSVEVAVGGRGCVETGSTFPSVCVANGFVFVLQLERIYSGDEEKRKEKSRDLNMFGKID